MRVLIIRGKISGRIGFRHFILHVDNPQISIQFRDFRQNAGPFRRQAQGQIQIRRTDSFHVLRRQRKCFVIGARRQYRHHVDQLAGQLLHKRGLRRNRHHDGGSGLRTNQKWRAGFPKHSGSQHNRAKSRNEPLLLFHPMPSNCQ